MKKYISLFVLIISAFVMQGQGIRNSLLGIYTGTYWDSYNNQDTLAAGVKIIALPDDSTGVISYDTINNIIDTLFVGFFYDINNLIVDTILYFPDFIDCGDVFPAKDSIFYGRCRIYNSWNPIGYISVKCIEHTFPTSINTNYQPKFSLFPNPTTDKLYISTERDLFKTYSIYTIYGQVVDSGIYNSTIEIGSLTVGMYYLKLSGKTEAVKSFIKQ